jgi:hypothetical protein
MSRWKDLWGRDTGGDSREVDSKEIFGRTRKGSPSGWRRTLLTSDGGGHTFKDALIYSREYFLEEESSQSSTYRELLGVYR